jgi:transposase, IS5 family
MQVRNQGVFLTRLDDLVRDGHPYRRLDGLVDFRDLCAPLQGLYSASGRPEKGIERAVRAAVLQFMEDLSDREMERYLDENMAARWFCGFGLGERSPDHSFFGDFRKRLGTRRMMDVFRRLRESLKDMGLIREVFTFVDASQLVSKLSTWEDRDRAITRGLETFNNETAEKAGAADRQARFGCKGKGKYWYGYKEHVSVDMQSGLINKVAATPANTGDAAGLAHVCPSQGAVYADKAYCVGPAQATLKSKGCHDATIKKANMLGKDRDKDRWHSKLRSPYERVFSGRSKRVRYRGVAKVQFQAGMSAMAFNLKRLMAIGVPRVHLVPA